MTDREFGNQNHASSEPEPPTKAPSVISVDQWDYAQGKFVERLVPNPDYKPYTCGECGTALRISEAKNYLGPLSTDGFRRKALVCEKCFEVLP